MATSTSLAAALPSRVTSPGRRAALSCTTSRAQPRPHPVRAVSSVGPRCRLVVTCNAQAAAPMSIGQGTPVRPTSVLVVGATGTLGRQVVRRALDEGYDVRCLVRPRPAPADFLRDWGATVVNADLSKPETIPATLVGVHTVIDCATGRPEEPIRTVDWEGKVALIQCAKAMGIQKYVFYSIHNCDKHPEVPLMEIKYCTERFIQDTGLDYTIIRLCGFMQVDAILILGFCFGQEIPFATHADARLQKALNKFLAKLPVYCS
uniref:NmrA-like domain-containing protein n=1 Tax=Triticum urartu TaxID=4572 RepID=A0A8R7V407_TRIUA